jgi:hypothetical protein
MREICLPGSEGGAKLVIRPYPYPQLAVLAGNLESRTITLEPVRLSQTIASLYSKHSRWLRRSPKALHPAIRLCSSQISTRLLKVNPDCDLRSMQRKLIEEVRVAEIIVKIPVTDLGKDVTGDLAA